MRYLLRRLLWMAAALLGVSVLIFLLVRLLPGTIIDIIAGTEGQLSREQRLEILHTFGLDRPLPVQYALWAWNLLHGNLGWSFRTSQPVAPLLVLASYAFRWGPALIYVPPWRDPWVNTQQMFLPVLSLALGLAAVVLRM